MYWLSHALSISLRSLRQPGVQDIRSFTCFEQYFISLRSLQECRETCRECKMCGVLHALNNITYLWGHSEDCWTVSGRCIPAESEAPTNCNQTAIRLLWIHWPTAKQKTKAPPGGPRPEIIVWGIVLVSFGVSFEAAADFGKSLSASPYSVSVLFEWTQPAAYDKITLWSKTLIVFHAVCIDGSWEKASINLNPYRFTYTIIW